MRICAAFLAIAACGSHAATSPARDDAATAAGHGDAASPELPARPLGLPALAGFGWRMRAGQAAFRTARRAEATGDWPAAVRACTQALAADPSHLDAAWLLAIADAKTGALDAVTAPLALAGAGDYGKWAVASLVHPALQAYLATPAGLAWRRRVDADRAGYLAALAHALVVSAAGDLYAYDATAPRWYRLTRTNGHVIAALAAGRVLAYVTRMHGGLGVGLVDLDDGHSTHAVAAGAAPLAITALPVSAQEARTAPEASPPAFWIGHGAAALALALDGTLAATAAHRPSGPRLEVTAAGSARIVRGPVASITADWDDHALASAIRIGTTNRVVTVPAPGLIAGNTLAWSPDRSHVAFVAQLADQCVPGAPTVAAVVADASTGTVQELARATAGLAIEWVTDRQLAIAGDAGVTLVSPGALGGTGAPLLLPGTTGLAAPRFTSRCTPPPAPVAESGSDDDPPEPAATP